MKDTKARIKTALIEAKKYKADAVYFRRFQHHSYSAPQVYIYLREFTDEELGAWLYNNNSINYRSHFLKKFKVSKVIDFTHLSDRLFHGRANVAVCATIVMDMPKKRSDELLHIVIKRSKVAEERFFFEIDHYDFHKVKYQLAIDNPFVWKANLLGGKRLLRLVEYLGNLRNLGDYLEDKKENSGWEYGEGYIIGHKGNLTSKEKVSNGFSTRKKNFK